MEGENERKEKRGTESGKRQRVRRKAREEERLREIGMKQNPEEEESNYRLRQFLNTFKRFEAAEKKAAKKKDEGRISKSAKKRSMKKARKSLIKAAEKVAGYEVVGVKNSDHMNAVRDLKKFWKEIGRDGLNTKVFILSEDRDMIIEIARLGADYRIDIAGHW